MTNHRPGTSGSLTAGPLEITGHELTIHDYHAYRAGRIIRHAAHRTLSLSPAAAAVWHLLMSRVGDIVSREDLLEACGEHAPEPAQFAAVCLRRVRTKLHLSADMFVDVVTEPAGCRLVVDEPAGRVGAGALRVHPSANWCWYGARWVRLPRRVVPVLATLVDEAPAVVAETELAHGLGLEIPTLRERVGDLHRPLARISPTLRIAREKRGYRLVGAVERTGPNA